MAFPVVAVKVKATDTLFRACRDERFAIRVFDHYDDAIKNSRSDNVVHEGGFEWKEEEYPFSALDGIYVVDSFLIDKPDL